MAEVSDRLGQNLRQLREARGLSQLQMAKVAGLPRATWTHLESGAGNPTLAVLCRVAAAFQLSLEELIAVPKAEGRHYPKRELTVRMRGVVAVRKLLPDPIPHVEFDRFELPKGAKMTGVPHTPGTREYLVCERGTLLLTAAGEKHLLEEGDVVVFRGDQRHAYENRGTGVAVAYSVVLLAPL